MKIEADVVSDCPDRGIGVPAKVGEGAPVVMPTTTHKYEPHCRANETMLSEAESAAAAAARGEMYGEQQQQQFALKQAQATLVAGVGAMSLERAWRS